MRILVAVALGFSIGCACNGPAPLTGPRDAGPRSDVTYPPGVGEDCANGVDDDGDGLVDCADIECAAPEPTTGDFLASYGFLFEGGTGTCASHGAQRGYVDGTIAPALFAIVRGRVIDRDSGAPIPGARVFVQGEPDLGEARTQGDGIFDLAVNAGSRVLVSISADGRVPIQRAMPVRPHDFTQAGDLALSLIDAAATTIHLGASGPQVHQGSQVVDDDGTRRSTVVFPSGVTATVRAVDGTTRTPTQLTLHATELTVGERGPDAMPGILPSTTSYTYGVEVSADEVDIQEESIEFSAPVSVFVDNFLAFPVGTRVPLGTYDRTAGTWHAEHDGRVIRVLGISGGRAQVDSDGDGREDSMLSPDARAGLASAYGAGAEFMWVQTSHFTFVDMNLLHALESGLPPLIGPGGTNGSCLRGGSIIECEDQVLGEVVPLAGGGALNYRSSRVPGFLPSRRIEFSVDPGSDLASLVQEIEITVDVAGQRIGPAVYPPHPGGGPVHIEWDGRDAYNNEVRGSAVATVILGYRYPAHYLDPQGSDDSSFDDPGHGDPLGEARSPDVLARRFEQRLGIVDPRADGIGGWTLSDHHFYDRTGHALWMGDGTIRDLRGAGTLLRWSTDPRGGWLATDPDGNLLTTRGGQLFRRRVTGETLVAGNGDLSVSSGDEGAATAASFLAALGPIACAPDGTIFVIDQASLFFGGSCVRRIDSSGVIHAFAGICGDTSAEDGDGGPATAAHMGALTGIAVDHEGAVYVSSLFANVVRRIRPDGIIERYAGGGTSFADGALATNIALSVPTGLAVDGDDRLLIGDATRIVRITRSPRGNVARGVIGGPEAGFAGDGDAAVSGLVHSVSSIIALPGGELCFADTANARVRCITGEGADLDSVAGGGTIPLTDTTYVLGIPAASADLSGVASVAPTRNGGLVISVGGFLLESTALFYLRADGLVQWPSPDGAAIYLFDHAGRHVRTVDSTVGATLLSFDYDAMGRLATVTDDSGHTLTVARDASGAPSSITGFFGHVHRLTTTGDGWLATVIDPLDATWSMPTDASGLLQSFTRTDGATSRFSYQEGRLTSDVGPDDGTLRLSSDLTAAGRAVTVSGPRAGQREVYGVASSRTPFVHDRSTELAAGQAVAVRYDVTGIRDITLPTRTRIYETFSADPRLGTAGTYISSRNITLPSGAVTTMSEYRTVDLDDDGEPATLPHAQTSRTVAGRTTVATWDPSTRTQSVSTPSGLTWARTSDAQGRVIADTPPGLAPTAYAYDTDGLLASVTIGTGPTARTWSYTYDRGALATATDPLLRTSTFVHDDAGRMLSGTTADGRAITVGYDALDRPTSITPPGRGTSTLSYSPGGALSSITPPTGSAAGSGISITHDADGEPDIRTQGSGVSIDYDRADDTGRVRGVRLARGVFLTTFGPDGLVQELSGPDGQRVAFDHDGDVVSAIHARGGPAPADVAFERAADAGEISGWSVAGVSVAITRDADGVPQQLGDLSISRDAATGLVAGATLGQVSSSVSRDTFGEETTRTFSIAGAPIFQSDVLSRDALGRITQIAETIEGVTHTYAYHYDPADRLDEVRRDGSVVETYAYEPNGGRTSFSREGVGGLDTNDGQDRLTDHAGETLVYRPDGAVTSRVSGAGTAAYEFDEVGTLLGATLRDGRHVTYDIDPRGHRVGRHVDGALERAWVYAESAQPIAEADASGAVHRVFVYGPSAGLAPDYFVDGSDSYRLVTDVRGSVRVVVRTSDGFVAQAIDYDSYGRVVRDTAPGFQPFGYAGGLYDPDTHLVRFGAREYDAETGRWLTADPSSFAGGLNPYEYAGGDPINHIDPSGEIVFVLLVVPFFVATMVTFGPTALHAIRTGDYQSCVYNPHLARDFVTNFAIEVATAGVGEIFAGLAAGRAALAAEEGMAGACRGGLCRGLCSFGDETLVETERGAVPIRDIGAADRVWSLDDSTGEWGYHDVTAMTQRVGRAVSLEIVDDEGGVTESLVVADNHPLFTRSRGWVEVGDLLPGDEVFTSCGGWARVGNGTWIEGDQTLYDLTVDGTHTYFVGEAGAWAHNCTPSLDAFSRAAGAQGGRGGETVAGSALRSHGGRPGTLFPAPSGSPSAVARTAQEVVDDILTTPGSTTVGRHHALYGDIYEIYAPDGRGLRYLGDGSFNTFIQR